MSILSLLGKLSVAHCSCGYQSKSSRGECCGKHPVWSGVPGFRGDLQECVQAGDLEEPVEVHILI